MPLVRRTRQTLRSAEFGFFGVVVYTRTQTPRFWGQDFRAGEAVLKRAASRPWRMSWLMVGMVWSLRPRWPRASDFSGRWTRVFRGARSIARRIALSRQVFSGGV